MKDRKIADAIARAEEIAEGALARLGKPAGTAVCKTASALTMLDNLINLIEGPEEVKTRMYSMLAEPLIYLGMELALKTNPKLNPDQINSEIKNQMFALANKMADIKEAL